MSKGIPNNSLRFSEVLNIRTNLNKDKIPFEGRKLFVSKQSHKDLYAHFHPGSTTPVIYNFLGFIVAVGNKLKGKEYTFESYKSDL